MSGRNPPPRPTIADMVSPSDVRQELNYIEWLEAELSGQDEYLAAMLRNDRILLMQMLLQFQDSSSRTTPIDQIQTDADGTPSGFNVSQRPVPVAELNNTAQVPIDALGIANRTIYENDIGPATFQVNGTIFATRVRMVDDVVSGDPVRVVAPGNIVEPVNDVALSLLGLPGSIGVDAFEVEETDNNVTIAPGDSAKVVQVTGASMDWVFTGTNDETHSLYQYFIDGDALFEEPLKEPLGLYNDPFHFPAPLSADRAFSVQVTRQTSASGSADYFSKVGYFE